MVTTSSLTLPPELVKKIEQRIKDTDFSSVSAYVTYILQQVLSTMEESGVQPSESSADEERKVQERLKRLESLGYMD